MIDPLLVGIAMLAVLALAYAVGTVRLYLAEEEKSREGIAAILLSPFPSERRLTPGGRIRARVGKIALCSLILSVAAICVRAYLS